MSALLVVSVAGAALAMSFSLAQAHGATLPPKLTPHSPFRAGFADVEWRLRARDCAPGRLTITVWRYGAKRPREISTWPDQACAWETDVVRYGRFRLRAEEGNDRLSAYLEEARLRVGFETFTYHVHFAGVELRAGWIDFRTTWVAGNPDQRIWQGTDAFVNYCIDKVKTIHSRHGTGGALQLGRAFGKESFPSSENLARAEQWFRGENRR